MAICLEQTKKEDFFMVQRSISGRFRFLLACLLGLGLALGSVSAVGAQHIVNGPASAFAFTL